MLWRFTNINNLLHKDASQLVGQILREALTKKKLRAIRQNLFQAFEEVPNWECHWMSLDSVSSKYIYIWNLLTPRVEQGWAPGLAVKDCKNRKKSDMQGPQAKVRSRKIGHLLLRMSIPGMMGRDKDTESLDIVSVCLSWHLEIPIAHGKMDENGRYWRDIIQKQRDYPLTG